MRCFTCFSNLISHGQIVCAINPEIADESEQKFARKGAAKKRVLVVGGGVAGMEAALTCAGRGHEVILCESSDRLGGVLRCEDDVPFKKHLQEYLEQQAMLVARAGIDIRTGTRVTKEMASGLAPDAIVATVGSKPVVPAIPGIDAPNVNSAEALYARPERAGKRVLVLGGGLVGTELAVYLAGLGREVTVMEMLPVLNSADNMLQGRAIGIEIGRLGITLALETRAVQISENGVLGETTAGPRFFEADTVALALGRAPLWAEADELRLCAPEFYQIGDCLAPKNIYEATRLAHQVALDIGER
jgi:pyruvate/2-oxoglutarate dehydrogenase complex dihydrolipoamide dehydrogenase (E3) component